MSTAREMLGPSLGKRAARDLETSARRHWGAVHRNMLMFCVELRQLQDGGGHLLRGFNNFAQDTEAKFEGIGASNAKQLSRMGGRSSP